MLKDRLEQLVRAAYNAAFAAASAYVLGEFRSFDPQTQAVLYAIASWAALLWNRYRGN